MSLATRTLGTVSPLAVSPRGLRCMGMSEFFGSADDEQSVATIRRALDLGVTDPLPTVHAVTALQTEYSLFTRDVEGEHLPLLRRHHERPRARPDDRRRTVYLPRFGVEALAANLRLVAEVRRMAEAKRCTPASWRWRCCSPRRRRRADPGTRKPDRVEGNVAAAAVELTAHDLADLETAVPRDAVAGTRYGDRSSIDT